MIMLKDIPGGRLVAQSLAEAVEALSLLMPARPTKKLGLILKAS